MINRHFLLSGIRCKGRFSLSIFIRTKLYGQYMEGRALMKKLNLLNFHFYARFSYSVSYYFIYLRTNAILFATVEISTLHQVIWLWQFLGHTLEHVTQLKVFKVGNFNVYLDLLLLIFRNWLLLSFNFSLLKSPKFML